jgi:hypothetical protein
LSQFPRDNNRKGGFYIYCKACKSSEYRLNRAVHLQRRREYHAKHKEIRNAKGRESYRKNRAARLAYRREWLENNRELKLVLDARSRARKKGVPFSLTAADVVIPELCPVLGIPLVFGKGTVCPNSPSIDRIVPELGYVPGNVIVVSFRANVIKQNATPDEIARVASFYQQLVPSSRFNRST